jgi:hypothetical protein
MSRLFARNINSIFKIITFKLVPCILYGPGNLKNDDIFLVELFVKNLLRGKRHPIHRKFFYRRKFQAKKNESPFKTF